MAPRFRLEVSPAMVAFGEMLMLPFAAMQQMIDDELSNNPALERLDCAECPICHGTLRSRCPVCSCPRLTATEDDRFGSALECADRESDVQALRRAVRLEASTADGPIVDYLVDSLDRHGLLDRSCAQFAVELGVEADVVARIVDLIRRCGPPGIGATDVRECLLLQLDALGLKDDGATLARKVISDHLPDLARGHFALIATTLGATSREIQQVLDLIRRRLRPYPAFDGNRAEVTRYVVPDVVVREDAANRGGFTVELVEPAISRLGVRPTPCRAATDRHSAMAVQQARSFVAQLRDRWETLRRVAECTVQRQGEFLTEGPTALRPLTRAQVAAALDLHESTVSRAVADKFLLLPNRTMVPLSELFCVSGGVDAQLRKLLEAEDGPISDRRLADLLRDAGYPIARRTVAKHRARLRLSASPLR